MKHSIISWDCSFRNFFHLIASLADQDFDKNQYEIIYVEQRAKVYADKYNHTFGLPSLGDKVDQLKNKVDVKVLYLDYDESVPYHLGLCNNAGIRQAKGEIISVMDGDTLVEPDFLKKLAKAHKGSAKIINLFRHMSDYPLGVTNYKDWKKGEIDFGKCLEASPTRDSQIPRHYPNKGPMISARQAYWEMTRGYDEHRLWSTSASTLGQDMCKRLEIASGTVSEALATAFCVHPWHPFGYARKGRVNCDEIITEYLNLQKQLTDWSVGQSIYDWHPRAEQAESLHKEYQTLIEEVIEEEKLDMLSGLDESSLDKPIVPLPPRVLKKSFLKKIKEKLKTLA